MVVSDRVQLLGRMVGDTMEEARVELTELGFAISEEIQALPRRCAMRGRKVRILAKVVMPEHVHFVLMVEQPMDVKLQMVLRGFKQGCNKRLRYWLERAGEVASVKGGEVASVENLTQPNGNAPLSLPSATALQGLPSSSTPQGLPGSSALRVLPAAVVQGGLPLGEVSFSNSTLSSPSSSPSSPLVSPERPLPLEVSAFMRHLASCGSERILSEHALFEEDFDETRLRRQGQLRSMIDYVHNNPRHRWLKQHRPKWLCVTRGIVIAGRSYDAIGNVNLLALPRHQVHCRYRWERFHDTEARRNHQNECVLKARTNYALVSPFVSPHEAAVRDFCLQEGHSVIVLHNNGFTNFSQCPGGLYDYCVEGQVLVLVPSEWPHDDRKNGCTREECTMLNGYAEEICGEGAA